jgi:hypothetical protein
MYLILDDTQVAEVYAYEIDQKAEEPIMKNEMNNVNRSTIYMELVNKIIAEQKKY